MKKNSIILILTFLIFTLNSSGISAELIMAGGKTWDVKITQRIKTDQKDWKGGVIHPLKLSLEVQSAMKNGDWLIFDGGNTHFWAEIAVNIDNFDHYLLAKIKRN